VDAASGSLLVGERLDDKYEVGELLGQGGMAAGATGRNWNTVLKLAAAVNG
jgi:hypothetical protein